MDSITADKETANRTMSNIAAHQLSSTLLAEQVKKLKDDYESQSHGG